MVITDVWMGRGCPKHTLKFLSNWMPSHAYMSSINHWNRELSLWPVLKPQAHFHWVSTLDLEGAWSWNELQWLDNNDRVPGDIPQWATPPKTQPISSAPGTCTTSLLLQQALDIPGKMRPILHHHWLNIIIIYIEQWVIKVEDKKCQEYHHFSHVIRTTITDIHHSWI